MRDLNDRDAQHSGGLAVRFTPAARRAMARLPMPVAQAALALITGDLAAQPFVVGKALRAPMEGLYSARRGEYRILYRVADRHVLIVDVRHRRDAYRS
jgi:mRNA interferase RelE/StbE